MKKRPSEHDFSRSRLGERVCSPGDPLIFYRQSAGCPLRLPSTNTAPEENAGTGKAGKLNQLSKTRSEPFVTLDSHYKEWCQSNQENKNKLLGTGGQRWAMPFLMRAPRLAWAVGPWAVISRGEAVSVGRCPLLSLPKGLADGHKELRCFRAKQ